MDGLFLRGTFVGSERRERIDNNGHIQVRHQYLITVGARPYKVTSEEDYTGRLMFGDAVTFSIRTNVYNNVLYLSGDLIDGDSA